MPVEFTFHSPRVSRDSNAAGGLVTYGNQLGDAVTVGDGAASDAFTNDGIIRVEALTDVRVRVGPGSLGNGSGGMRLYAGERQAFSVAAGEKLGVSALA